MRSPRVWGATLVLAASTVTACVDPDDARGDAGVVDGGADDGGVVVDAGLVDGGGVDAGVDAGVDESCPAFAAGATVGFILDFAVEEASGVVAGRTNPGTLWVHNDSGAQPIIYAVTTAGRPRGTFTLEGAEARDWEDIAVGPGPVADQSYLYIGDIGDNDLTRESARIYRVAEPLIDRPPGEVVNLVDVETIKVRYPDGPHNAETLLVDPASGDVIIVVKSSDGVSPVFVARAPLSTSTTMALEQVATLRFGEPPLGGDPRSTGGDIAADGHAVIIRTYDAAFLWRWPRGSIIDALAGEPCAIPLRDEGQGEAIAFAADAGGYFTVSEGPVPPLYFFAGVPAASPP